MARTLSVIGLSRTMIEGQCAENGEPAACVAAVAAPEPGAEASLDGFFAQAAFPPSAAVIVLATEEAAFRKLFFPFRDPRRIGQVIRFELESELLDDVSQYLIDHEIAPTGEDGAEVHACLVKSDRVQAAVAASRGAGLSPYRVTLSAHALLMTHPPAEPLAYQVYAGGEECFVSLVREGRIAALHSISTGLPSLVLELQRQGISSAAEIHSVLRGESGSEKINRAPVRSRALGELALLADELNLFLRVHDRGAPFGVVCFGLFGPFLRLGTSGRIEVIEDPPPPLAGGGRRHLGILHELGGHLAALRSHRGVNFYTTGFGWRGYLPELRRPLILAGVLLALVAIIAGTRYALQTRELWRQKAEVEAQIQAIVQKHIAANPPFATAVPILRERVQKARDDARGTARFAGYRYDALELLAEVSAAAGAAGGVTVESFAAGKERLSIVGTTPSFQASEALRNRLAALPRFKGREPKLTHQRAGQTITFRLTVE